MGIILEIIQGGKTGFKTELDQERITIGRESSPGKRTNDIDFDHYKDISASRKHAVVEKSGLGYILEEINGKGNTLVNGSAVKRKILRNNDIIQFGSGGPSVRVLLPDDPGAVRGRNVPSGGLKTVYGEKKEIVGRRTLLEVMGSHNVRLERRISSAGKKAAAAITLGIILAFALASSIYFGIQYYNKLERTDRMLEAFAAESEARLAGMINDLRVRGELTDQRMSGLRAEYALLKKTLPSMSSVIRDIRGSVVKIKNVYDLVESGSGKMAVYKGKPCRFSAQGSGLCIREDGYIITNAHIVSPWLFHPEITEKGFRGKSKIRHLAFDGENRVREYQVIAVDIKKDLALLKIEGGGFNALKPSAFIPSPGDSVAILGFPAVLEDSSAAAYCSVIGGNVSKVEDDGTVLYSMISGSGNSGGPLVTQDGRLAGLHISGLFYDGGAYFVRQGAEDMISMTELEKNRLFDDSGGQVEIDDHDSLFKKRDSGRKEAISRGISSAMIVEFAARHLK